MSDYLPTQQRLTCPKGNDEPMPESSHSVFDEYARYYDLLYRDKDYQAEADYVAGLIQRFNPKAQSILELGSGTGIHAALLTEKGFTVHGIGSAELLARSLALTKKNMISGHDRLTFSQGDIRHIRLSRQFDTVISLFHVISHSVRESEPA